MMTEKGPCSHYNEEAHYCEKCLELFVRDRTKCTFCEGHARNGEWVCWECHVKNVKKVKELGLLRFLTPFAFIEAMKEAVTKEAMEDADAKGF